MVHYLAKNGTRNYVQWRTLHSTQNGLCTVKLGLGDSSTTILYPKDGSGNSDGSFPCGNSVGYEGKEFMFPNYTCDECTLQFLFNTGKGKIHQCADLMIGD